MRCHTPAKYTQSLLRFIHDESKIYYEKQQQHSNEGNWEKKIYSNNIAVARKMKNNENE